MDTEDASKVVALLPKPAVIPLLREDIDRAVNMMPESLRVMLMRRPFAGVFVAGGWIRASIAREDKPTDVDLFCEKLHDDLVYQSRIMGEVISDTGSAITYEIDGTAVQIICTWKFAKPEDAIIAFDFTICQAAIWYKHDDATWYGLCSPRFYPDLAARRLSFTGKREGAGAERSLFRVLKYLRRGYTISESGLAEVAVASFHAAGGDQELIDAARGMEYV